MTVYPILTGSLTVLFQLNCKDNKTHCYLGDEHHVKNRVKLINSHTPTKHTYARTHILTYIRVYIFSFTPESSWSRLNLPQRKTISSLSCRNTFFLDIDNITLDCVFSIVLQWTNSVMKSRRPHVKKLSEWIVLSCLNKSVPLSVTDRFILVT